MVIIFIAGEGFLQMFLWPKESFSELIKTYMYSTMYSGVQYSKSYSKCCVQCTVYCTLYRSALLWSRSRMYCKFVTVGTVFGLWILLVILNVTILVQDAGTVCMLVEATICLQNSKWKLWLVARKYNTVLVCILELKKYRLRLKVNFGLMNDNLFYI